MSISQIDIFKASILIVDDQEANITLLKMLLSEAGYTNVSATSDSQEVCALHRKNRYDLILLDLQIPVMDGFQVMEALKMNQDDPYLSVVVLTAQPGHKVPALLAGAKDFISKPFDLNEVKTRIRNVLEVRLLYKKLAQYNIDLEAMVKERTEELCESEARFRSLTELATDCYWEQDESGRFTKVYGPLLETLGIRVDSFVEDRIEVPLNGWNKEDRADLLSRIARRQSFLGLTLSRTERDGKRQIIHISGQPMFNNTCNIIGYRGIGVEVFA